MRGNISEIYDGGDLLLLGRYSALGKLPREMRQPLRASLMLRGMMKHPDAVRQVRLAWTEWYSHPQAGIISDDEIYQMLDADLHRGKIQGVPIPHVRMSFESGKVAALQQAARPVGGRRGTAAAASHGATASNASVSTSTTTGTNGQKPVSAWSTEERISAVIRRTIPKVPGRARQAMMGLLSPESIATMALTMGIVAAMNLTPYGWAADAVLAGVAFGFGGLAALEALGDLVECFRKTASAQNEVDIELAATALAKAVVVLGALGLMAILHKISSRKGSGSPGEGEPDPVGPARGAGGGRTGDSPSSRRAAPPKDEAPPPPPPKPKADTPPTPKADGAAAAARTSQRMSDLASEGHGPQRHEGQVTQKQLVERSVEGKDPMTGTTTDGVTGKKHKVGDTASKVNSEEAYVKADDALRNSQQFKDAEAAARQKMADVDKAQDAIIAQTKKDGADAIAAAQGKGKAAVDKATKKAADDLQKAQDKAAKAKEAAAQMDGVSMPLKDIYGPDYQKNVSGMTRNVDKATAKQQLDNGAKPEDLSAPTDFKDGTMQGYYRIENGKPAMTTMYPNPKP